MTFICLKTHTLTLIALLAGVGNGLAANTWNYQQDIDRLNNQPFSFALSPLPRRDLYDDLRLEVICKNQTLHVVLNTESLITSQNGKFDMSYQIDKNPPVALQMKTFAYSKRRAYADGQALNIIKDMLAGKEAIFVKVTTMTRRELAGAITLDGATQAVQKVVDDCATEISKTPQSDSPKPENTASDYSLNAFEEDFNKLDAAQQKQVLDQIKKLLADTKP